MLTEILNFSFVILGIFVYCYSRIKHKLNLVNYFLMAYFFFIIVFVVGMLNFLGAINLENSRDFGNTLMVCAFLLSLSFYILYKDELVQFVSESLIFIYISLLLVYLNFKYGLNNLNISVIIILSIIYLWFLYELISNKHRENKFYKTLIYFIYAFLLVSIVILTHGENILTLDMVQSRNSFQVYFGFFSYGLFLMFLFVNLFNFLYLLPHKQYKYKYDFLKIGAKYKFEESIEQTEFLSKKYGGTSGNRNVTFVILFSILLLFFVNSYFEIVSNFVLFNLFFAYVPIILQRILVRF